jgi:hypothetical protein
MVFILFLTGTTIIYIYGIQCDVLIDVYDMKWLNQTTNPVLQEFMMFVVKYSMFTNFGICKTLLLLSLYARDN